MYNSSLCCSSFIVYHACHRDGVILASVAYFREIYDLSGYPLVDEKAGNWKYTEYQQAARAKIFRREQSTVKDLESIQRLMRANGMNNVLLLMQHMPYQAINAVDVNG